MEKMTITEALAEIKLIEAKILKKKALVAQNLVRPAQVDDPFEKEGGANQKLTSEIQAIRDLNLKRIRIRESISEANLNNKITVGEVTQTITAWLTWKREIADQDLDFYKNIHTRIKEEQDRFSKQPQVYQDVETKETRLVKVVPHLDYSTYLKLEEVTSDILERLDGQLSLKNATLVITI